MAGTLRARRTNHSVADGSGKSRLIFHPCKYDQEAPLTLHCANGFRIDLNPGRCCPLISISSSADWRRKIEERDGVLNLCASVADGSGRLYRYMDTIPCEVLLPRSNSYCRGSRFGPMPGGGAMLLSMNAPETQLQPIALEDRQVFTPPPEHDAFYLQISEADEGLKVRLSTYERSRLRGFFPIEGASIDYLVPIERVLWRGEPVNRDSNVRTSATATIVHTGRAEQLGIPIDSSPLRVSPSERLQ